MSPYMSLQMSLYVLTDVLICVLICALICALMCALICALKCVHSGGKDGKIRVWNNDLEAMRTYDISAAALTTVHK